MRAVTVLFASTLVLVPGCLGNNHIATNTTVTNPPTQSQDCTGHCWLVQAVVWQYEFNSSFDREKVAKALATLNASVTHQSNDSVDATLVPCEVHNCLSFYAWANGSFLALQVDIAGADALYSTIDDAMASGYHICSVRGSDVARLRDQFAEALGEVVTHEKSCRPIAAPSPP